MKRINNRKNEARKSNFWGELTNGMKFRTGDGRQPRPPRVKKDKRSK